MPDAAPDIPDRPPVRVREAMLAEPRAFRADATAQEAGVVLARVEVRSVLVVDGEGRLVGEVTRAGLVAGVVAAGLDPCKVRLAAIAVPVARTIDADMEVDAAFRLLEEFDAERLPVVEAGRLVGALSRSVLQRRLAEDEPPPDPES